MRNGRTGPWFFAAMLASGLFLAGCGGGGKPIVTAKKDIKKAEGLIDDAGYLESKHEYDQAKSNYEEAASVLAAANRKATKSERTQIDSLSSKVATQLGGISLKKQKYQREQEKKEEEAARLKREEEEKKKLQAMTKTGLTPEEEAKKKAEEEAKKKAEEEAKLKAAMAAAQEKPKEEELAPAVPKEGAEGAEGAEGEKVAAKEEAPAGPFKKLGPNPPEISIDKLEVKGDYVIAYAQLSNSKDTGRRIGRVIGTFKDSTNSAVTESLGSYDFQFFDTAAKDPTEQGNSKCFIAAGSHEVPAKGTLQVVLIGQHQRAKAVTKVVIDVMFDDGSSITDVGPSSILGQEEKAVIPGL